MTERRVAAIRDEPGAAWEKRGNATWLRCPACAVAFPVGPAMLLAGSPPCRCPRCHHEFRPGADRAEPAP